jgi:membrane fusion protein
MAGSPRVYPNAPAEIRKVHVRAGAQVEAGDPLVTISLAQGQGGIVGQVGELQRQEMELARQQELASMLGSTAAQALAQQKASLTAAIASLERQRSLAASQIGISKLRCEGPPGSPRKERGASARSRMHAPRFSPAALK